MSVGNTTVDERIVEMRIDNEKFEAGAKKTIGILESLDRSLKGLGQENADGFDNIGKSLDKVTDRFSAMGIVGDQIMRNLTNKTLELVGQLKNMSTMLTTQQVGAGWNKYADKTSAIQTIMAATNKTIEEGRFADQVEQLEWVNEQIEKLNKFTDETSYNFLDMVGNIGKFTAAGRGLEESVTAMEGIANWAAISGGRPAEASRAMYNLSQALGMGKVTQLDWKSIENANMATYEFKQQVIEVAEELGTVRKIADGIWEDADGHEVTVETFRDNLKDGWFDSDVLLKVLNRYGEFSDVLLDVSDATGKTATEILSQIKAYKETGRVADWLSPYIQNLTKDEYELGLRAFQAAQEAKTFTEAIDATKDAVSTKWMTVFELLFGNYLEAKELWTNMAEVFWDIFAQPVDHLIDIIKGSGGFLDEGGMFQGFVSGAKQAVGGTGALEDRLSAVGKTMKDFEKALEKTLGPNEARKLMDSYGTITDALKDGAISAETFKKALGELDDSYDPSKPVSLNRALNKAGKTMTDFEKAIEKVGDRAAIDLIENFGGVEEALKRGGISAELFKKALESLGIDSENVAETVEESVQSSVASLAEMRELALEVLRGDHGNGDERLAWYESMGLDAELMQAMAGDLKNMGYYMSDEALMGAMEAYYQYNDLASRLGYATFAEYLGSLTSVTEDYIYDMNSMADEADMIYASLFGEGVLDEYNNYISAGELFRKSLTNLLEALDNFGSAFDQAFMRVFGGADNYEDQIANMSDGFFTLTAAFYSFSERVKAFSESETFLNFATAFFSIIKMIGKALSVVFKIGKIGLSLITKLLSPVLTLIRGVFDMITTGFDAVSRSLDSSGLTDFIDVIGDILLDKIEKPIEKINYVIETLISAFRHGFDAEGGIVGGLQNMMIAMDQLFENHPVFLSIIHAIGDAFIFLKDALAGLAVTVGSIFGGAVMLAISGIQALVGWFGELINWAKSSDLLTGIWNSLTAALKKFGEVMKRVYEYAEQGYQEGGFIGAITAVAASFERGIKRLIPGGEKLIEIFDAVKDAARGLFKKKIVNENGVEEEIDQTEDSLLRLEETFDKHGGFFTNIIRGAGGDEEAKEEVQEGVTGLVQSAWQGFLNGLRNIRISDVIDALKLGVIANVLLKVGHGLNIFNGIADSIGDIPDRFTDMFEDLGQTFRSLSFDIKANAVIKFAAAAAMIAGAIWILSKIPSDKLEKASSTMIVILTLLVVFANMLQKTAGNIFKGFQFMPIIGTSLIGFAMLVSSIGTTALILALVAKFVGVNELWTAANVVITIVGVIGVILAGIILLTKGANFNSFQIKAIGSMFMRMGIGLMGLALAVQMLMIPILAFSAVLKFARGKAGVGKFTLAVGAVIGLLLAVGGFVAIIMTSVRNMDEKGISAAGNLLFKVAISMIGVVFSIQMLIVPVAALAALQKYIGKEETKNAVIAVAGLIGYISVLVGIFAWFLTQAGYSNMQEIGKTLLRTAASMLIVVVAIRMLVKPITEIAELSKKVEDIFILRSILYLLGAITAIGLVLVALNRLGNFRSGDALLHISGAIALLAFSILLLTPAILLITGAIIAFIRALGSMDDKKWETFENGLERLGKFWKPLFKFGAALAVVGLAATLTGAGILSMSLGILVFAGALAIIMLAFPKFMEMLEGLKDIDFNDLWNSIRKVLLSFVIFGGLLAAILVSLNALTGKLNGKIFKNIGKGFIKTIKDMAIGMRSGVSNGFASVLKFLQDDKNKQAILATLEALIIVGAAYVAGILPTVAHVVIGGLVGLLNAVAAEVSAQAPEIVAALNNIVKALVKVAAGLFDSIAGTNLLGFLTENEEALDRITGLVEGLGIAFGTLNLIMPFKDLITTLTGAKGVTKAIGSVQTAASMTDKIMIGLSGSASRYFTTLAASIGSVLGPVLMLAGAAAYANHYLNEQQDILRTNAGDPKSLDEYATSIANVEARIAELTELEKSGWGTEISSQELGAQKLLLSNLKKEYEELKASEEETIATTTESVEATNRLSDAEMQRQEQLEARKLKSQEAVVATQEETEAIDEMTVSVSENKTKLEELKNYLSENAPDLDINKYINGDKLNISSLRDAINEAIGGGNLSIDTSEITSTLSGLGLEMNGSMLGVAKDAVGGFTEGWDGSVGDVLLKLFGFGDLAEAKTRAGLESNSPSEKFARIGDDVDAGLGEGIDRSYYMAVNPLYRLMDEMSSAFVNVRGHFIGSGAEVVSGLIQGIADNMQYAYDAGQNLAASLENGFREKLLIQSPSRVFAQLARYIPLGIEEGINTESTSAITSVTVLGDALINAIMQSMAMVSTVASDDFEFSPRITPVVDMSNISAAASSMDSTFGNGYNISAQMTNAISKRMADVERIAADVGSNQTVNNGDNITFNIYGAEGQDPNEIADAVMLRMQNRAVRRGAAFG